uniref:Insulin like growth factor binding protein 7 n=1 Tax=Equus caballus TaxID=9796 RepID=A0A9L0T2V5_HORSE
MERSQLRALLLGAAGLLLLLLPLSSSSSSDACGPCEPAACPPLPPRGCPLGETRDACGCCPVCARGEGEPCGGGGAGRGHCAPGMECVKSRKRRKGKAGAAAGGPGVSGVCVCKSRYPVCGSDGITYPSGCQLRAASLRAESRGEKAVTQVSKGTCEQGPSIVTPPKDIWNVTGAQVYLSCEVIGIPTPVLIWNKVSGTDFGKTSWTDRLLSLHKDGNNQTSSACSVACCSSKAKPAAVFQTTPQHLWTDFTDLG